MVAACRPASTVGVTNVVVGHSVGANARSSSRRPPRMARVCRRHGCGSAASSSSVITFLRGGQELVDSFADRLELEKEAVVPVGAVDHLVLALLARRVQRIAQLPLEVRRV